MIFTKYKKYLLWISLALLIGLNLNLYSRIRAERRSFNKLHKDYLKQATYLDYFERCFKHSTELASDQLSIPDHIDFGVYFSGDVCPSCAESLLHYLSKDEAIMKETLVFVNTKAKLELVIGYNDSYNKKFEFIYEQEELIEDKNEILLLSMMNGNIRAVLEYRPDEENLFIKYFEQFYKRL